MPADLEAYYRLSGSGQEALIPERKAKSRC